LLSNDNIDSITVIRHLDYDLVMIVGRLARTTIDKDGRRPHGNAVDFDKDPLPPSWIAPFVFAKMDR
jgi:hypothetical protein